MEKENLKETIAAIIAKVCKLEPSEVNGGGQLMDGLGADSLDLVEIAMDLEKEYEISIPDVELEQFKEWNIDQVMDYVEAKIG